jgi:hypothetical protein
MHNSYTQNKMLGSHIITKENMQQNECDKQLFIYINNFLKFYFICENQGVTNLPPLK